MPAHPGRSLDPLAPASVNTPTGLWGENRAEPAARTCGVTHLRPGSPFGPELRAGFPSGGVRKKKVTLGDWRAESDGCSRVWGYFGVLPPDAELCVPAVVSQRNQGLADVAFLPVAAETQSKQLELWLRGRPPLPRSRRSLPAGGAVAAAAGLGRLFLAHLPCPLPPRLQRGF